MSLEIAKRWTCLKEGWKMHLILSQLYVFFQLTSGLIGQNIDTARDKRLPIILGISIPSPYILKEFCVFCIQILRIFVWSIWGRGVPKGVKWEIKTSFGFEGCQGFVFPELDGMEAVKGLWVAHFVICSRCYLDDVEGGWRNLLVGELDCEKVSIPRWFCPKHWTCKHKVISIIDSGVEQGSTHSSFSVLFVIEINVNGAMSEGVDSIHV